MLIEAIIAYLGAIVGPDGPTCKLWLGIMTVGGIACVLLLSFR